MHYSIATVSLSGTLLEKIDAIAAAGFDGIELFEPDFIQFAGSPADLGRMCQDRGLTIDLFQPFRDFEGMPQAQFARSLERAERKFDLMQALGVPLMLVCSNVSPLAIDDPELASAQLHELAERAARRGLRIGFEALAWGRHVRLWSQAWHIVRRAAHPSLGLVLDSFHTLSLKDDPSGIAQVPGDRIFFVQMADAPLLNMDVVDWARHHRNFPGQGQLDVAGFFEQAVRAGYAGPLSLEIFNDVFRETPNRRIAVDGMRSLRWLEGQVSERLKGSTDSAARGGARPVPCPLPDIPRLAGISLVEFAVDEAAAEALGTLLGQLGFRRVGRHRRKLETLYRQGGIHLLLSCQAHESAGERFRQHGPSVAAIGLRVADPKVACDRAVALQSARANAAGAPGEHPAFSIVAPGGSILHFVDASLGARELYAEFDLDDSNPEQDAGLHEVDHIAMALAPDRVDTWVLFCRAVLGLEAGDSLKLADPYGLIRSFGMADLGRGLRLVLNVPLSQRTRTARVASASGGAAVQHIAFHSQDIVESVRRMRRSGVRFVPISGNYYDDLLTRTQLDLALIASLRENGILFDSSPDGHYFHACTEPFADRFHFEIVQRLDGYDAYGAVNAPARMASQARQRIDGAAGWAVQYPGRPVDGGMPGHPMLPHVSHSPEFRP